jgi:cell wall-associated NlpC family hydrolase
MNPDEQTQSFLEQEYICRDILHLYDSPECTELATQAAPRRHLHVAANFTQNAMPYDGEAYAVILCEDAYQAWLPLADVNKLEPTQNPYQPPTVSRPEIEQSIPTVIAFAQAAMKQPNRYLWGGTVAPNYDCSGLVQAAFNSVGIWLPRDSYQQAEFTQPVAVEDLQLGDLLFFAAAERVNHVALYLGDNYYIHSSGIEFGRNGIGIDELREDGNAVSRTYYQQFWGAGRVMSSYQPRLELNRRICAGDVVSSVLPQN